MKIVNNRSSIIAFLMLFIGFLFVSLQGYSQSAKDIVTRAEDNIRGTSSVVEMTIEIIRPSWTRSINVKAWSKGEEYSIDGSHCSGKRCGYGFLKAHEGNMELAAQY